MIIKNKLLYKSNNDKIMIQIYNKNNKSECYMIKARLQIIL